MHFVHFLLHITGGDVPPDPWYDEWSGFLGDVTFVIAPFTVAYAYLRNKNCEVHSCWRITKHHTIAGHNVCKRHAPVREMSHQDILDAYQSKLND